MPLLQKINSHIFHLSALGCSHFIRWVVRRLKILLWPFRLNTLVDVSSLHPVVVYAHLSKNLGFPAPVHTHILVLERYAR